MQNEYLTLGIMTLLFLFAWIPVSVGKYQTFGGRWLASNRRPVANKELVSWAARCERAYSNLKDNFPVFAVSVLILGATNKFSEYTSIACATYVVARIGHYVAYGMGNVLFRFIFFVIGIFMNLYLLIKIFV